MKFNKILNELFPATCKICNKSIDFNRWLCDTCKNEIKDTSIDSYENIDIYHYGNYEPPLSNLIKTFKFNSHTRLGYEFGDMLTTLLLELNISIKKNTGVSFVPSSKNSYKSKGFIPARILSKKISNNLKLTHYELFESRAKHRQVELNREDRIKSLKNKIYLKDPPPKNLVIVDDVFTTGASMNCALSLIKSECKSIVCLTLAKSITLKNHIDKV